MSILPSSDEFSNTDRETPVSLLAAVAQQHRESGDETKENRIGRAYKPHGERKIMQFLLGKFKAYGLLGRRRSRWEQNIKMSLKEKALMLWAIFIWLWTGTCGGLL